MVVGAEFNGGRLGEEGTGQTRQALLELYDAVVIGTPNNDFEVH
jgi:hypothetical protein